MDDALSDATRGGGEAALQAALEEARQVNIQLTAQLEVVRGRLRQQIEATEAANKTAERALTDLRHKVATQSHQLKAREAETQRLQERLVRDLSERDAAQKLRERQVFQEVHRRAPRPTSAADSRSLEVIEVYESQRRAMQTEIDDLRAATNQLTAELCEKENLIARKDAFHSWRTPDQGELLARLQEAQNDASEARAEAQRAEARVAELLREARQAESDARRQAEMERARAAALELDLQARPTRKQWTEAQGIIERLRTALPLLIETEDAPLDTHFSASSGHPVIDSAEAIRRDREVNALGLQTLRMMPQPTIVKLLQNCCRELQLTDAQLLPSALRKMCRALAALPPMEAFIREVCALALSRAAPTEAPSVRVPSTKAVLLVLQRWTHELGELEQLRDLVAVLSQALGKRTLPGGAFGVVSPLAAPGAAPGALEPLTPRDILHAVNDLVQQERKALRAIDTFERADLHLHLQPEDLLSKLCTHFGRLFSLKSTEGMLPKMNELYLFVNEQHNLLKVLRSMLGLEMSASSHALLGALRQALDLAALPSDADGTADGAAKAAKDGSSTAKPPSAGAATEPSANTSTPAGAARALPQYVAIAAELRQLMHARSILHIIPAVKEMKQELTQHQRIHQQMQGLVTKLCKALAAGSAEAALAQEIQGLVSSPTAGRPTSPKK
jgi:hypothetical protein